MASSNILRSKVPLNRCLQQWNNHRAYQNISTPLNNSRMQHCVSINSTPRQLCLFQGIRNQGSVQSRSLYYSRTLHQEGPKNPLEPTEVKPKSSKSSGILGNVVDFVPKLKGGFSFFNVRSLLSSPYPFAVYGLGGVIPFAAAPLYMHFVGYCPSVAYAQLVYGATILSFLGGVSWGKKLDSSKLDLKSLAYSIYLPLLGWAAVLIHPNFVSFYMLMSGVAFAGYRDTREAIYPSWFKNLRFLLSSIVFTCLFSTEYYRLTRQRPSDSGT